MSVRVSSIVWDTDFPTQSMKLIALKLADNSSDAGDSIYPAKDTIAEMTGCSRSTVHAVISDFIACGLLIELERGGKGPGHTTHYRFDMEMLWALSAGVFLFVKDDTTCQLSVVEREVEEPLGEGTEKGPEIGPIGELRVQPLDLRVQRLDKKGPTIGPKPSLNRQEPSRGYAGAKVARVPRDDAAPVASTWIKPDTPQWSAWRAHEMRRLKRQSAPMDGKDQWMVPSEYPPVEKGARQ